MLSEDKCKSLEEKKRNEARKIEHAFLLYRFFKQAWADDDNLLSYKASPELRATEEDAKQQLREEVGKIKADGNLDPEIKRLINRIERFENYLFTYLKHPGIPPDNNVAERELRPFVIMRRTSHDFKNEDVMDSFTFYLSFYQTCKKNMVDFGKELKSVLSGDVSSILKAIRAHYILIFISVIPADIGLK
ncbi:MAG: transposase [Candidatus Lokiarchaeota archaeon]|nr:transposase [Candidatus Lokiarchaeota archaeon]